MAKLVITNPSVTLGGVDITDEISSAECPAKAEKLDTSNGASAGYEDSVGGKKSASCTLNLKLEADASAGVWNVLKSNFGGTVALIVKNDSGTTDADNPAFTGTVVVLDVPFGGAVNSLHEHSITLPLTGSFDWATS